MTDTSATLSNCPQCGTALPPGGVAGHCPRCLGRTVFIQEEEHPTDDGEAWAVLGDCELLEEIGRGGMGVVYKARQRRLGREVAVKVLRGGEFAGAEARGRFKAEAENAARLRHPGIVAVYDFGEEQGVCWISMEFIAGRNLDDVTRAQPMAAADAAQCVRLIAAAVQHAHEQDVLHRDLKPSNILLSADAQPHIADFGIARRMEGTESFTRTGQVLGSPGFTAPEQALRGTADARTDVYGLGAVLYSVLTGRPPFQGPTADSVLLQLRENDPLPPRQLNPAVPRDLETIALKCLAREPARRYASAAAVADDLAAFLEGRPVRARAVSSVEKIWRWCRRRPALAAALAFAVLALVGGTVVSLLLAGRARESASRALASESRALASESRALAAAEETRRALYAATMLRAYDDLHEGSPLAAPALEGLLPAPGQKDLRGWEWHWLHAQLHQGTLRLQEKRIGEPRAVAWSPDGKRLAVSAMADERSRARLIQIRDAATFAVQQTLTGYDREVPWLHWHPDSLRLLASDAAGGVSVWDTATGVRLVKLSLDPVDLSKYQPPRAAWSPDGTQFAAISYRTGLTLHQADNGAIIRTLMEVSAGENAFAWHPAGERIAVVAQPPHRLCIISTGGEMLAALPQPDGVSALAWNPDGTRLAIGTANSQLRILSPDKPETAILSNLRLGTVGHLLWTPDGQRVIYGGWTGVPIVINAATGTAEQFCYGHGFGWITSLALHGDRLLSWCKDATLREWNLGPQPGEFAVPGPVTRLQLCGPQHELRGDVHQAEPFGRMAVWQENGTLRTEPFRWARAIAWTADGTRFALLRNLDPARYGLGFLGKRGALIELRTAAAPDASALGTAIRTDYPVNEILWSPQGDRLLLISATSQPPFCTVLSAQDGRELCRLSAAPDHNAINPELPNAAAWSPDGKRIALGAGSILYDAATGQPASAAVTDSMVRFRKEVGGPPISLAWSPDQTRLAFGYSDGGHVLLLDTRDGTWRALRPIHSGWVRALAFSPDGTRLATAGRDATVKVLAAENLATLLELRDHRSDVRTVAWSADGRTLASADREGRILKRRLPQTIP